MTDTTRKPALHECPRCGAMVSLCVLETGDVYLGSDERLYASLLEGIADRSDEDAMGVWS